MKTKWRKLTDGIKRGSGFSQINEPKWYELLYETFAETYEDLEQKIYRYSRAEDLSFSLNEESDWSTSLPEENVENHGKSPQVNAEERQKKTSYCTAQKEKSGKVADTRIESASLWYGENSSSNNFEEPGADLRREEMSLAFRRKAAKKNRGYKQRNAVNVCKDVF